MMEIETETMMKDSVSQLSDVDDEIVETGHVQAITA